MNDQFLMMFGLLALAFIAECSYQRALRKHRGE